MKGQGIEDLSHLLPDLQQVSQSDLRRAFAATIGALESARQAFGTTRPHRQHFPTDEAFDRAIAFHHGLMDKMLCVENKVHALWHAMELVLDASAAGEEVH
jgi:hypothetical protein